MAAIRSAPPNTQQKQSSAVFPQIIQTFDKPVNLVFVDALSDLFDLQKILIDVLHQ